MEITFDKGLKQDWAEKYLPKKLEKYLTHRFKNHYQYKSIHLVKRSNRYIIIGYGVEQDIKGKPMPNYKDLKEVGIKI